MSLIGFFINDTTVRIKKGDILILRKEGTPKATLQWKRPDKERCLLKENDDKLSVPNLEAAAVYEIACLIFSTSGLQSSLPEKRGDLLIFEAKESVST